MTRSTKKRVLKFLGWTAAAFSIMALAAILVAASMYAHYEKRAAAFDLAKIDEVAERSAVYDANGDFYSYFGGMNRMVVPLSKVSKHFIDALLAREDARFWEHGGVDIMGVARALVTNILAGDSKQGASTITQQLARNACELHGKTLDRKALEAVLAQRIERTYSKEQILEFYVNRIYFGTSYYGIETAARGYFGKSAANLTLGEAATLAGLIRSPNKLAPTQDADVARGERDDVLDRMVEANMLTSAEAVAAKASVVTVKPHKRMRPAQDYVMDAVNEELEGMLAPEVLEYGGLKVWMTIDPQLQRLAESAANRTLTEIEEKEGFPHPRKNDFVPATDEEGDKETDYLQSAVVAIENKTGAVRAIVGGRDYKHSRFSRALMAKRPVGSTFKPFVYAAAFERGLLPGTAIDDSKIAPGEFRNISGNWSPENSDGEYGGMQPAAFGLLKSRNTMTVRIGEFVGLPTVRDLANRAGIGEAIPDYPVAFLGAFETTLKDLTSAYTVFPNLGTRHTPYMIARVEDREGRVLYEAPRQEQRVMSKGTAWMVSAILQQVMKTGTAAKSQSMGWTKPGAGKTGTTNDFFDAWFVGYTSSLTCGVWVGMDKPQTIAKKAYGSAMALPIWVDFMQHVPENKYPAQEFKGPAEIVKARLCSVSGAKATSACVTHGYAYDASLPAASAPSGTCRTHPEPPTATTYAVQPGDPQGVPAAGGTLPQPVYQGQPLAQQQGQAPSATLPPSSQVVQPPPPRATANAPIRITPPRPHPEATGGTINPGQFNYPAAWPESSQQPRRRGNRRAQATGYQQPQQQQPRAPVAQPTQRRVIVEEPVRAAPVAQAPRGPKLRTQRNTARREDAPETVQAKPIEVRKAIPVDRNIRTGIFVDEEEEDDD